jgi:hypothetical protein
VAKVNGWLTKQEAALWHEYKRLRAEHNELSDAKAVLSLIAQK